MKSFPITALILLLPASMLVSQETHTVDHPAMIASMKARNPSDTREGEALYNAVC
ncbi:MAG: hypothetical protein HOK49_01400, partial [Opitutae bacterium]|nr:hypothetical protein [Opitutae bacterium]